MNTLQERKKILQKELEFILNKLKTDYKPERVILFGSLAHERVHEWSDIDLVIIKNTNKRFIERLKEVALLCRPRVGVNFLVYTPLEVEQMQKEKRLFFTEEIFKKGKEIYHAK